MLLSLWLPILLSTVAVFFLSFLMWMVFPHHKKDFKKLPDEDGLMNAIRSQDMGAGQFAFPFCTDKAQMKDPEWMKRWEGGPSGFLTVRPAGPFNMGKNMFQSITFNLVVSICVAYVATISFTPGDYGLDIFRLTAMAAWMAYAFAHFWGPIWTSKAWSATLREVFIDGLVYGLATGAIFCFLWPS